MKRMISRLRYGFYYGLLSIDEQVLYKKIGITVSEMGSEVILQNFQRKELNKVLIAIKYDNAEFFYWDSEKSALKGNMLLLQYRLENQEDVVVILEKIRMERNKLIAAACDGKSVSSKEILYKIYQYMKENVTLGELETMRPECSKWIYDIEGVFIKKKAACLGISLALNYICEYLHLSSILITGTLFCNEKERYHGWNLVCIDDEYYHFDLAKEIEMNTMDSMHYFMVTSDTLNDRNWSKSVYTQT